MAKGHIDPLELLRKQIQDYISRQYSTVEQFCWDKNLNKATVSNFLNGKKDFQTSTLLKLAEATGRHLIIKLGEKD